ncbi:MAG: ankyrin repeat domain-containing protein [Candidatus Cardinium sp.]|nr:ankyrin repeat domain-containing protein [Candidatus Cardinium sp.]
MQCCQNLLHKDNRWQTPLHLATYHEHANCITTLIKEGADVNQKGNQWWTPLHLAAKYGYADCISVLINKGGHCKPTK